MRPRTTRAGPAAPGARGAPAAPPPPQRRWRFARAVAVMLLGIFGSARRGWAADGRGDCGCHAVLIQNCAARTLTAETVLDLYVLTDRTTFDQLEATLGPDFQLGAYRLAAAWETFAAHRTTKLGDLRPEDRAVAAAARLRSVVSAWARQAYDVCQQVCSRGGLVTVPTYRSTDTVFVAFRWRKALGIPPSIPLTSSWLTGGRARNAGVLPGAALPAGMMLEGDTTFSRVYDRVPGRDFRLRVRAGDAIQTVFIPAERHTVAPTTLIVRFERITVPGTPEEGHGDTFTLCPEARWRRAGDPTPRDAAPVTGPDCPTRCVSLRPAPDPVAIEACIEFPLAPDAKVLEVFVPRRAGAGSGAAGGVRLAKLEKVFGVWRVTAFSSPARLDFARAGTPSRTGTLDYRIELR